MALARTASHPPLTCGRGPDPTPPGHITRNLSNLRPREKFDDRNDAKDLYTHRAPDAGILEHERRRRVEVKCLELEVSLQDDGVEEDLVIEQVSTLRQKLLAQSASANGTEREPGSIKSYERHELGQAKALQNERAFLALRDEGGVGSGVLTST